MKNLKLILFNVIIVQLILLSFSNQLIAKAPKDSSENDKPVAYKIDNVSEMIELGNGFTACTWLENESSIIFTKKGFTGLLTANLINKTTTEISNEKGIGYKYQIVDNGNYLVAKYATDEKAGQLRKEGVKVYNLETNKLLHNLIFDHSRISIPYLEKNDPSKVKVLVGDKFSNIDVAEMNLTSKKRAENQKEGFWNKYPLVYTDNGLRLYKDNEEIAIADMYGIDATISPNGKLMCYNYKGILKIRDGNENEIIVGNGLNASWLPNSKAIVYQITEDDGQEITNSDIYIYNVELKTTTQLTDTPSIFEEYPSISANSKKMVYTDINQGTIFIADFFAQ